MDFYDKFCGHKFNKHKYRHAFSDTINSMKACGTEVETTEYFLLHFHFHRRFWTSWESWTEISRFKCKNDQIFILLYGSQTQFQNSQSRNC